MKRVAIYVRCAAKNKEEVMQAKAELLQNFVCEQGGTVVDIYIDNGYSGCNMRRPELKRLLADCKSGKIDDVLISEQSRLSRKFADYMKICKMFRKYGVSLTSAESGKIDNAVENRLLYKPIKLKGLA